MSNLIVISFIWLLFFSATVETDLPDLAKKEDLKALGIGKIIGKDKSIIIKIVLEEVKEYGVVYIKNESLHDIAMDDIARIEFLHTPWGALEIRFPGNKPEISLLQ